ncbi:alpha/beta fold hydrolase [Pseudoduganella umbonata]|uniref:Alpha/beta hydrolase n=1 Tax=Pseudoduganella umbonata TaxID=864828 RepID=A0A4P8HS65_9BURK|nr:alpha/beta hydrolase [Pseudoduganella umbonata]MBB3223905.1 pimeloyl-ACP methyl ester carboxylesterase [Pseudoduganella umbonata]QCP12687.1 alpha/beta hydrolase [Pseudoduganella umbonata]
MLQLSRKQTAWAAAAVGALAASYMVVRSKTKQAEVENPPTGQFVTVDGVKLHYLQRGAGPVVVLLHGNGATSLDFELSGLIDMLARDHTVIAFDRPGFGYSDRPRSTVWTPPEQAALLARALAELHVDKAIVVGHSWGTLVSLAMAMDHPDLVNGLVLMAGYYYPNPRADVVLMSGPAIPLVGDVMRFTVSPLVSRLLWPGFVKKVFSPRPVADSFRRWPKWLSLRPSQLRAASAESVLMIPAAANLRHRYAEITLPVTIFTGTGDKVVDPGHNAERLHRELLQSQLHTVQDAGHMLHYVAQDEIVRAVRDIAEGRPRMDFQHTTHHLEGDNSQPRVLH